MDVLRDDGPVLISVEGHWAIDDCDGDQHDGGVVPRRRYDDDDAEVSGRVTLAAVTDDKLAPAAGSGVAVGLVADDADDRAPATRGGNGRVVVDGAGTIHVAATAGSGDTGLQVAVDDDDRWADAVGSEAATIMLLDSAAARVLMHTSATSG